MAVGHWAKGYLGDAGDGPAMNDIEGLDIQNPQDGQTIVYDAASGTWKNGEGSGGGGGGGGAGIFWVNGEFQEDDSLTLDKTYSEIKAAFNGGEMVVLKTTFFDDEAQDISLYYLTYCGGNIIFKAMPDVTSDAVYGRVITIYDDDSVVVIATSMEAPDPEG